MTLEQILFSQGFGARRQCRLLIARGEVDACLLVGSDAVALLSAAVDSPDEVGATKRRAGAEEDVAGREERPARDARGVG